MLVLSNGNYKSGSTWVTSILYNLIELNTLDYPNEFSQPKFKNRLNRFKIIDFINSSYYNRQEYWLSKTHIFQHEIISEIVNVNEIKIININRDLKDVIVSHYFHLLNSKKISLSFNAYYLLIGKYKAIQCMYYAKNWEKYNYKNNVLNLCYSDLQKSIKSEIIKIVNFLNIDEYSIDINDIIEKSSLSENRKKQNLLNEKAWFFRKGLEGDYVNYLNKKQILKINHIQNGHINSIDKFFYFILFEIRVGIKFFMYKNFPIFFRTVDKYI